MENVNEPKIMMQGVPVRVTSVNDNNNSGAERSIQIPKRIESSSEVSASLASESRRAPENLKRIPEVEAKKADKKHDDIVDFADFIAEKAKVDGVDKALEELARKENTEEPRFTKKIEEAEPIEKERENSEIGKKELTAASEPRFDYELKYLQEKVGKLAADNEILKNRIEELSEMNREALLTAQQFMEALMEMIKEEEDEEKKSSLEKILNFLTTFIMAIMPGNEEEKAEGKEDVKDDEKTLPEIMMTA